MEESEYNEVYDRINSSKIQSLSKRYGLHEKMLTIILNQKIVRDVRRRSHEIKKNSQIIRKRWDRGEKILSIAKELEFPPALISSMLLKELGFSDKGKKRALKDPSNISDPRMRSEVIEALKEDLVYSPTAHKGQMIRGKLGESIISNWLTEKKIGFIPETASKGANTKTPDFLFEDAVEINGRSVKWIESKASFGDMELHKYYIEKQYSSCLEMFGDGMVVYWYGYVETIREIEPRLFVVDHDFFPESHTKGLFEG